MPEPMQKSWTQRLKEAALSAMTAQPRAMIEATKTLPATDRYGRDTVMSRTEQMANDAGTSVGERLRSPEAERVGKAIQALMDKGENVVSMPTGSISSYRLGPEAREASPTVKYLDDARRHVMERAIAGHNPDPITPLEGLEASKNAYHDATLDNQFAQEAAEMKRKMALTQGN